MPASDLALNSMQRVLESRVLRVGYFEDRVPLSFRNARGELVGYDNLCYTHRRIERLRMSAPWRFQRC